MQIGKYVQMQEFIEKIAAMPLHGECGECGLVNKVEDPERDTTCLCGGSVYIQKDDYEPLCVLIAEARQIKGDH